MNELTFIGNKVIYLILMLSALPICVATVVGLLVGLFQTVTQLQEQTLSFGLKLLSIMICLFLISGWYGEILLNFAHEVIQLAFIR